jgi:hypothetical protein
MLVHERASPRTETYCCTVVPPNEKEAMEMIANNDGRPSVEKISNAIEAVCVCPGLGATFTQSSQQ